MNWPFTTIASVTQRTSTRDPRARPNDLFQYIDIASIDRDQKEIVQAAELKGADAPSRARKVVKAGDILVSTVRPNLNTVAIVPPELDGQIASTGFCVLRPDRELVEERYLFYYIRTAGFIDALTSKVRGAHYPAVSDRDVKNTELPLPPLKEQRRIVEILDQADALRKQRAEADKKAARILPALFYQMFGDPVTNSKTVKRKTLGELVIINPKKTELKSRLLSSSDLVSFISMSAIDDRWGQIAEHDVRPLAEVSRGYTYFSENDVLFAKITPCMENGKAAIARSLENGVGFGSTEFHVLRAIAGVTPEWIFGLVRLPIFRKLAKTRFTGAVGRQRVPADFLKSFVVPIPNKDKLEIYSRFVRGFFAEIQRIETSQKRLDVLFDVLLHQAFSGVLTAKWRETHMNELLQEMEHQATVLRAG